MSNRVKFGFHCYLPSLTHSLTNPTKKWFHLKLYRKQWPQKWFEWYFPFTTVYYTQTRTRKPCPVFWYPTICLLTWYQTISWSLKLNKCHGDINLDEVLEVKGKACRLWLRWRTTFTTTPPNNNIGRSNTGKLNGYLGIKSTAMLLCLTERWTLSRRIRSEIIGAVCLLALFFSRATR